MRFYGLPWMSATSLSKRTNALALSGWLRWNSVLLAGGVQQLGVPLRPPACQQPLVVRPAPDLQLVVAHADEDPLAPEPPQARRAADDRVHARCPRRTRTSTAPPAWRAPTAPSPRPPLWSPTGSTGAAAPSPSPRRGGSRCARRCRPR
jgi:hypothetical protein